MTEWLAVTADLKDRLDLVGDWTPDIVFNKGEG